MVPTKLSMHKTLGIFNAYFYKKTKYVLKTGMEKWYSNQQSFNIRSKQLSIYDDVQRMERGFILSSKHTSISEVKGKQD